MQLLSNRKIHFLPGLNICEVVARLGRRPLFEVCSVYVFLMMFVFAGFGMTTRAYAATNLDQLDEKALLAMSLGDLLDIKVSIATTDKQSIHEAPSIITVISNDEINSLNPRNLSDILNLVPGFNMTIESLHAPLVQFRGSGNRQDNILLMIDGHRLNSQIFGGISFIINDIPVDLIDHIEIIRGPGSAIYGSNAFKAVINVVTITDEPGQQSKLFGKYDSDTTINGGFIYRNNRDESQLLISASVLHSDGPDDKFIDRSGFKDSVDFEQEVGNLYAFYRHGYWQAKAFYNSEEVGPFAGIVRYLNDDTQRTYTTMFVEGGFNRDIGENSQITTRIYYDSFGYDCDWTVIPARLYPPNGFDQQAEARDLRLGGEIVFKTLLFDNHNLMFGVNYDLIELNNSSLYQTDGTGMVKVDGSWIEEESNYHYSLYVQDQFPLFAGIKFTAGLRYDDYDVYGDTVNPRLGLNVPISDNNHLKLLYGSAFRAPSYYESNTRPAGGLVPNKDIEPEELETFEAEYCFQLGDLTGRINAYYTVIDDLIKTVKVPGGNTKKNYYDIESYGTEGELKYIYAQNRHSVTINGFLNHSEDSDHQEILYVPNYGAVLILDDKWFDSFTSNIQVKYVGRMKKANIYNSDGSLMFDVDEIPDSISVNLALNYRYRNLTIKAAAYNIFDESLVSPVSSTLNALGEVQEDYPYARRSFMIGLEFDF